MNTTTVSAALDALPGNEEERRCFHLFRSITVVQLSGLFGSDFWNRLVLQACLGEPTI
jgi:hypothetical protein